jgi:mono/diheme cytochrome c family protein
VPPGKPVLRIVFRPLMSASRTEHTSRRRRGRGAGAGAPRAAAATLLLGGAIAVSGCSVKGADNANVIVGKQTFVAKCGSCHTLSRAGTKGVVGPNLDDAFRASIVEGLERDSVRGVVEDQIRLPNPEGAMLKDLVKGSQLKDIAAYVAQVADRPGKDTGLLATAVEAPGAGKPAVEKGGKLSIAASPSGQLAYVTNKASGTAGPVTIEMPNASGVMHNIALEAGSKGATGSGPTIVKSAFTTKTTASVSVTLKAGTYTFFCEAPGHRAAGMFGVLTVK